MDEKFVEYDRKADVLYIWYQHPADVDDVIAEHREDGIIIKKNCSTDRVIGVTILHLSQRSTDTTAIEIPETTV
ncbi:MAG: DUF2283 domain-containing protein [Candidatus Nanohaloarchaea archaeon]|nr:DUF2283 domain-containing protein [Candidatus Nanohaloarchaea archaeon]